MEIFFSRFDNFCHHTIQQCRIDISRLSFDNKTDKEVFVIKHLINVMHMLYNGIKDHSQDNDYCQELKSIASRHLQQYTAELYHALHYTVTSAERL